MATTTIRRLQTRLDGLALEQLRQVAAQQQARIEELEQYLAEAEDRAEFWQDRAYDLQNSILDADLAEAVGQVGITKDGQIGIVN